MPGPQPAAGAGEEPAPRPIAATAAAAGPEQLPSEDDAWALLGRADVIVRGVLEAQDGAQRRRWQERARAWLRDVNQTWVQRPAPPAPARRRP